MYRLRADTAYGYERDDWLHTPLVAPDARLDLTTEQIEETLKYFRKSGERTSRRELHPEYIRFPVKGGGRKLSSRRIQEDESWRGTAARTRERDLSTAWYCVSVRVCESGVCLRTGVAVVTSQRRQRTKRGFKEKTKQREESDVSDARHRLAPASVLFPLQRNLHSTSLPPPAGGRRVGSVCAG